MEEGIRRYKGNSAMARMVGLPYLQLCIVSGRSELLRICPILGIGNILGLVAIGFFVKTVYR